jgi:hypothetical protein
MSEEKKKQDYRTDKEKYYDKVLKGEIVLDDIQERKFLFEKCNNKNELKQWIEYFLEFKLPDNIVSRYSDCSPFHAVWEMYEIAVLNNNPKEIQELLYLAGRGGGKCNHKSSILLTDKGIKQIKDIKENDIVYSGWNWQKVLQVFNEGVKPGIKIKTHKNIYKEYNTKHGSFDLCGSLKHRIQALNPTTKQIDWVYLTDLKKGQLIYKSSFNPYNIEKTSKEYELGWLCAAITGDGRVGKKEKSLTFTNSDYKCLRHFINISNKYFKTKYKVKRESKKSVTIVGNNLSQMLDWYSSLIEGKLYYFKKLKTIEHDPNFLAGFIAGIMDTDGSFDIIELANKELIEQISKILTVFGISSSVIYNSRKPSKTCFVKDYTVTYHRCKINTKLHDFLLPIFNKRQRDLNYWSKVNNQFSYPVELFESFAIYMHKKYKNKSNKWTHPKLKSTKTNKTFYGWRKISHFATDKKNKTTYSYVDRKVIKQWIKICNDINEQYWVDYLNFILNGYYERVLDIERGEYYFYDLEVEKDHSYWSNGFVNHNTLGTAIAEFLFILHSRRNVAHVGIIQPQAERCYAYLQEMINKKKVKKHLIPEKELNLKPMVKKTNMKKTEFEIGDETCSYEILSCTMQQLNGIHAETVSCIGSTTRITLWNKKFIFSSNKEKFPTIAAGSLYKVFHNDRPGDIYLCTYNEKTEQIEKSKLLEARYMGKKKRIKFTLNDKHNINMICTPDHLIYDPVLLKYKEAQNFKIGDLILSMDHRKENVIIKEILNMEFIHNPKNVYDFKVEKNNNFFAGSVLVHNCDELDTADKPEVLKAFKEISGMLDSRPGKKALRIGISTRKSRFGLMNSQIENAEKEGRHVRQWTSLEFIEHCPSSRTGSKKVKAYVYQDELLCVTPVEYMKLKDEDKKNFVEMELYEGCTKCPACCVCFGDLKKQRSNSNMLKPVTDLIKKVMEAGPEWALNQLINLKPSLSGIIYKEFNEKRNVKTWNEMWYQLTGREFPGECNHDIFISKCKEMELTCLAGIDFGWSNPSTFVCAYIDKRDNIYIVRSDAVTEMNDPTWIHYIKNHYHYIYGVELYYPDIANQSAVDIMSQEGLNVADYVRKDVQFGIQLIKKFLQIPGTRNTKVFIAKETCGFIIDEFQKYHYKMKADGTPSDTPSKEFDHCFTEGHQILTEKGWIDFKDLNDNIKVGAITHNKEIIFEKPTRIINKKYKGKVYNFNQNKYNNFEVTSEHDIVYINHWHHRKTKKNILYKCKPYEVKSNQIFLPKSAQTNKKNEYKQPFPELGISDKQWAYLLGMFLNDNNYQTYISKITGITTFELKKKKYYEYFSQFGKCDEKFIPRDILEKADIETLKMLFQGLMDGDGSILGKNNDYTTTSLQLANDFSELATLCGYSNHIKGPFYPKNLEWKPYYKVRINKRKAYPTIYFQKKNIEEKEYEGNVYCVTVSTGMIMIRKGVNGSNFISGNCLDAFKYIMLGAFAEGGLSSGIYIDEADRRSELMTSDGLYTRVPTAAEVADKQGMPFNHNAEDINKPKRIGTLSELDKWDEIDEDF